MVGNLSSLESTSFNATNNCFASEMLLIAFWILETICDFAVYLGPGVGRILPSSLLSNAFGSYGVGVILGVRSTEPGLRRVGLYNCFSFRPLPSAVAGVNGLAAAPFVVNSLLLIEVNLDIKSCSSCHFIPPLLQVISIKLT